MGRDGRIAHPLEILINAALSWWLLNGPELEAVRPGEQCWMETVQCGQALWWGSGVYLWRSPAHLGFGLLLCASLLFFCCGFPALLVCPEGQLYLSGSAFSPHRARCWSVSLSLQDQSRACDYGANLLVLNFYCLFIYFFYFKVKHLQGWKLKKKKQL